MKNKLFIVPFFALSVVATLLSVSNPASAASTDPVPLTTTVHMGGESNVGSTLSPCDPSVDMTTSWSEIMYNTSSPYYYKNTWNYQSNYDNARYYQDQFFDRLDTNINSGDVPASGWGVAQSYDNGYPETTIFTFDPTATITINDGYLAVSGSSVWMHKFAFNPNAGCRFQDLSYSHGSTTTLPNSASTYGWKYLFIATDNMIYPSGYTGSPIPSSTPGSVTTYSPDLERKSAPTDRNIIIQDNNFYTFDEVPFVCENELAPAIHWELWLGDDPDTDTLINSGVQSPTATINFTIPYNTNGNFRFLTWYDCGEDDETSLAQSDLTFSFSPVDASDYSPAWYISKILDFKGTFHDTNFNTFDGNPFLCQDDLAPVIHYELFRVTDAGDVLISSGVQSSTAQIDYDFGKADLDRDYNLVGWYDCGDTDPLQFDEQGRLEFTINKTGTQVVDLFEDCVMETFPFINIEGCVNNMYTMINLLAFGEVKFPTFSFDPNCRQLQTMDEWLGLPNNYQVCPQIPSSVRNVTTPFVAFMLGIVTLGFLQRRSGGFNG